MSKTLVNFCLDVCLLAVFVALSTVTAILQFVFPAPIGAEGWSLWGWDYTSWHDLQFGIICVMAAAVLLHVMLHWPWVCGVIATRILRTKQQTDDGIRTIWGVATLIVLFHVVAITVGAALFMVESPK